MSHTHSGLELVRYVVAHVFRVHDMSGCYGYQHYFTYNTSCFMGLCIGKIFFSVCDGCCCCEWFCYSKLHFCFIEMEVCVVWKFLHCGALKNKVHPFSEWSILYLYFIISVTCSNPPTPRWKWYIWPGSNVPLFCASSQVALIWFRGRTYKEGKEGGGHSLTSPAASPSCNLSFGCLI